MNIRKTYMKNISRKQSGFLQTAIGIAMLLLLAIAGCSDKNIGHIHGKVTLDGQPLSSGSVVFENKAANISIFAPLSPDGTYQLRTHDKNGLPADTYQIAIRPYQPSSGLVMANPNQRPSGAELSIPTKYWDSSTSGFTAEVHAGDNLPFDFALVK